LSTPFQIRSLMVDIGRRLYQRNHIGAAEGNMSARLSDGSIMITPSGINKGFMKPEDLVVCNAAGKKLQGAGKPSSEIKLHVAIYNWRPNINAICHAHPIYATAYSAARIPLMRPILPEVVSTIGGVPLAPYGAPGSSDLPERLAGMIEKYNAFLLEAHGVLTLGKSMEEAFNNIEIVERFANILCVAESLGPVKELSPGEIERMLKSAGRLEIKDDIMRHAVGVQSSAQVETGASQPAEDFAARKSDISGYR
jgi:L-fuculose-phosphate aldolase